MVSKGSIDYKEFMILQRAISSSLSPEEFFNKTVELIDRVRMFEAISRVEDVVKASSLNTNLNTDGFGKFLSDIPDEKVTLKRDIDDAMAQENLPALSDEKPQLDIDGVMVLDPPYGSWTPPKHEPQEWTPGWPPQDS